MTPEESTLLRRLLLEQPVAALATLHKGEPAVSMVPFAWWPLRNSVLIHVSELATHTQDMQRHAQVSLLVTATLNEADTPLALPRASIVGHAQALTPDDAHHAVAREVYLAKLPDAEPLFEFGDFSLFEIVPAHLRWVAGFGRAMAVRADALNTLMQA